MAPTLEEARKFYSDMFEKQTTYSKVVIGLGYAGFFTAWSGTKQHLAPKAAIASALCMTISLMIYLIFEIWQGFTVSYLAMELGRVSLEDPVAGAKAFAAFEAKLRKSMKPLVTTWMKVFISSAVIGLAGTAILIYAFVAGLFKL